MESRISTRRRARYRGPAIALAIRPAGFLAIGFLAMGFLAMGPATRAGAGTSAMGPATRAGAGTSALPSCGTCTLVTITKAQLSEFAPRVALTGDIQPKFQSNIAFRVSGKIAQRLVEIGAHVAADEVLAKLETQEQKANVDTAAAGLASAQALYTQAKIGFERQDALFKQGFTTRPSFDQAKQNLRTQQAAVDSAQASLGTAKEQLGYTDLKAGVAGIVTARDAETGQVIQAGQTVFTLAQDGPRDAVFNVYEALLTEPPASKEVQIFLQSDPSIKTTGAVREISPTVDSSNGSVKVKVGLTSTPPGMSLGATVVGSGEFKPDKAIVLPRGALFALDNAPAVWLYDPKSGAVKPRAVSIERFSGNVLVLSGGIEPGEIVVTAGIQFLHPGQIVDVVQKDLVQ